MREAIDLNQTLHRANPQSWTKIIIIVEEINFSNKFQSNTWISIEQNKFNFISLPLHPKQSQIVTESVLFLTDQYCPGWGKEGGALI